MSDEQTAVKEITASNNNNAPPWILPANQPLGSFLVSDDGDDDDSDDGDSDSDRDRDFSILSWNILLPNSVDNWWCDKMFASWIPPEKRAWSHRQGLIREKILRADADIVCVQEADGDTFEDDFAFMAEAGYGHVLHRKFRFRCATFFKEEKFIVEQVGHKDRTLVTELRTIQKGRRGNDDDDDDDDRRRRIRCHPTSLRRRSRTHPSRFREE